MNVRKHFAARQLPLYVTHTWWGWPQRFVLAVVTKEQGCLPVEMSFVSLWHRHHSWLCQEPIPGGCVCVCVCFAGWFKIPFLHTRFDFPRWLGIGKCFAFLWISVCVWASWTGKNPHSEAMLHVSLTFRASFWGEEECEMCTQQQPGVPWIAFLAFSHGI